MGYLALGGVLRRLSSSHIMTSKRAEACSADDKQASKTVDACPAERPNPVASLVSSKIDGANDDASACTDAGSQFVKGLELVLTHMTQASRVANRQTRLKVTPFHSEKPPGMSIQDYLHRIRKYFRCSDECFVLALVYIDRVAKVDPDMAVSALNAHRLLLIAVVLAAKSQDDVFYSNSYYAKVGGLALKEANSLEEHFVKMLAWELYVGPEEYQFYHTAVCAATSDPGPLQVRVQAREGQPHCEAEPETCGQCGHVKLACVCQSLSISL